MTDSEKAIDLSYKLESLLRVLSLAVEGETAHGMTFERAGGGTILDMAADMAGEITERMEREGKMGGP